MKNIQANGVVFSPISVVITENDDEHWRKLGDLCIEVNCEAAIFTTETKIWYWMDC